MAIINNNVQNVKFLRNQTPFVTRDWHVKPWRTIKV